MSIGIAVISITALIQGHVFSANRIELEHTTRAAKELAVQRLEQTYAARWDEGATPPLDELKTINFPGVNRDFNLPRIGTNQMTGKVRTVVEDVSQSPKVRRVRVDVIWEYREGVFYTNSVIAYRSPDL